MNPLNISSRIFSLITLTLFAFGLDLFAFSSEKALEIGLLNEILISKKTNILEIKILFSPDTSYRRFELNNPKRVVFDFFNLENITSDRVLEVSDFGIWRIRAGMFNNDTARVVIDLEETILPYIVEKTEGCLKVIFKKEKVEAPRLEKPETVIKSSYLSFGYSVCFGYVYLYLGSVRFAVKK